MKVYASHLGDYMKRWIIRFRWFNLRLHKIQQSDEGRDYHDHPFTFTSFILKGGYIEHRPGCRCWVLKLVTEEHTMVPPHSPCREYSAPAIVHRKAEEFHRLELTGGAAWTFVVAGPYRREWGFLLPNGDWQHFEDYHRSYYKGKTHG